MKVLVNFKCPDAVGNATDDLRDEYTDAEIESAYDFISQYVAYGEYVTIEFDVEKKTALVLKRMYNR